MGHRRHRKRDRRSIDSVDLFREPPDPGRPRLSSSIDHLFDFSDFADVLTHRAKTCGTCREFVEDEEGGRGTCLHPGSGVLSPWTDSESCHFYFTQRGIQPRR